MRVVAVVHFSMPWRCAGSETVLHELLKTAVAAGHDVACYVTDCGDGPPYELDGVTIYRCRNVLQATRLATRIRPDVIVSHHQHVLAAIRTARSAQARSVYLVHNEMDLNQRPLGMAPDLVIYNTEWTRDSLTKWHHPDSGSMVMLPPLTPERHLVPSTGDCLTLVNLNEHKGANVFYRLAELLPDRKFLGVVGGHGKQIVRRDLPNVEIVEHQPNMGRIWAGTRILLMPSIYESYGLVAMEAALNGIPTIANPTPGLVENLGVGGIFVDRDDLDGWVTEVNNLSNQSVYGLHSLYAKTRASQALKKTVTNLGQWVDWVG